MTSSTNKPRYERPVLVRHQSGLMNKFGHVRTMRPQTHIDGVAVKELVATYGSPLFVFSEKTLVSRYRELRDAFSLRSPRVRIAWSYKTNYLDAICRVFHREGAWAEVVSEFEYDKALHLGVAPDQIHFNGPYKPEPILERALQDGAIVHLDHFDELAAAERIAERHGIKPRVALRLNLAVEGIPAWTRFGFNLESGQAKTAVTRLIGVDNSSSWASILTSGPSSSSPRLTGRPPRSSPASPTTSAANTGSPWSSSTSAADSPRTTSSRRNTSRPSRLPPRSLATQRRWPTGCRS